MADNPDSTAPATEAGRLWGGRFTSGPSPALHALSRSIQVDWRLAPYDLAQTRGYVLALRTAGVLSVDESALLVEAIDTLAHDVQAGSIGPESMDEDVHGALERILIERVGDVGSKARYGRSRNDQVATDLRLYLRAAARQIAAVIIDLAEALLDRAARTSEVIAPGFTHLQHAQPLLLGHEFAKHVHRLLRDLSRLRDWDVRAAISPLGASAVAGTSVEVDTDALARTLGFTAAAGNSIDATTDRDFVAELCFVAAMTGVHVSQLAEEICLWSSTEFGWVLLDDAWSTGSSIMPQKKNPDVAELARGKTGRLVGDLVSVLTTLKALPYGYNRDLQEDKEPVFDAVDTLVLVLPAVTGLIATLHVESARITSTATTGYTLATEIADWLASRGVPFREAHEAAGACVRQAEARGVDLAALTDEEFAAVSPLLTPDVRAVLSAAAAISARQRTGGTGRLTEQLADLRNATDTARAWWGQ